MAQQEKSRYLLRNKRAVFDKAVLRYHLLLKTKFVRFFVETRPLVFLSSPLIYCMILPLLFLDVFFTVYQHICFRIYRLKLVPRRPYMVADRHHLAYLNVMQKFNCLYCSYSNGVIAYVREITARTEDFWCPIKNAGEVHIPHHKYYEFVEFGDVDGFEQWRKERDAHIASDKHDATTK